MNKFARCVVALSIAGSLSACGLLEPRYRQPELPVQDSWPIAATTAPGDNANVADIGWREFFVDARLQQLIELALKNNRDLRMAVANVERARSLYRIQRADRVPSIDASGSMVRQRAPSSAAFNAANGYPITEVYSAELGVSAFELDLFGRVRSLSRSALQQYLAEEEARRSAQLSLIAEVGNAYLTLAAYRELQRLAEETLKNEEDSFRLTQQRYERGAISGLDLAQAQTTVENARVDTARYEGQAIQARNALTLLVGVTIQDALLPDDFESSVMGLDSLPAGLPSQVLLRRPDILQAEHQLRAANANIGAARAAFLPNISLTGTVGTASTELSDLFKTGTETWSFIPQVTIPIFQGGRLLANLGVAKADRDFALAQYERAIQAGFRETADALALTQTLSRQRQAQQTFVEAANKAYDLSEERYRSGRDSYLTLLIAQRAEYAARQGLIATRLAEQSNRVTLYKVLGGGWRERSP